MSAVGHVSNLTHRKILSLRTLVRGCVYVTATFIVDELGDFIFRCKLPSLPSSMLNNSSAQVIGDTGIEDGVVFVGHDVNAVLAVGHFYFCL